MVWGGFCAREYVLQIATEQICTKNKTMESERPKKVNCLMRVEDIMFVLLIEGNGARNCANLVHNAGFILLLQIISKQFLMSTMRLKSP
jgi:hypothetical protein